MLEWTGERFLPWIRESTLAYEHLHRYAFAAAFVEGKRVLDLASGEGYGAKMLATTAAAVVGIDIDANVVKHAAEKYSASNLRFIEGPITAVPIPDDHSFDVIICFEAIEHIEDHRALLDEVQRLLKPDGLFIVSTPNKALYHDQSHEQNPFHVKELYFNEFQELLGRYFSRTRFLGQRIQCGSSLWTIAARSGGLHEFVVDRNNSEFEFIAADKRVPLYYIAVASNAAALPAVLGSVLLDDSDSLFEEKNEQLRWREQQVVERGQTIQSLDEAVKWHEGQVRDLTETLAEMQKALDWKQSQVKDLEQTIDSRDNAIAFHENTIVSLGQTISSHEKALEWRAQQVSDLQTAKEYLERESASTTVQLQNAQRQLAAASDALAGIYASRGWKFLMKLRSIRDRLKALGKSRG